MTGRREDLRRHIQSRNAPTALSALSALDAAFLLFSFGHLAQAVFLFHHSIELAMKGYLEGIHVILTADRPDYKLLKWIARDQIKKHSLASNIQIPDDLSSYDPGKTCHFIEALTRVNETLRFSTETANLLRKLNDLKNKIVHYGNKDIDRIKYVEVILKKPCGHSFGSFIKKLMMPISHLCSIKKNKLEN